LETEPFLLLILAGIDITFYPVTGGILAALLTVLVLLFGSAMISGSEVAFFSLSPSDLSSLSESGTKRSQAILNTLRKPRRLLGTILITNNFINVGIVIISAYIMGSTIDFSGSQVLEFIIQVVVVTLILLLFGEILPKFYANQYSMRFALFMVYPLRVFEKIFYPLSSFLIFSTSIVNKRIKKKQNISMDDLSGALEITANDIAEEKDILEGIIKFGNIDVSEIMKARINVVAVDIKAKLSELIEIVIESGYSRIPVYTENPDNIKGVLYIKDLLPHLHKSDNFKWQSLIRPPYYVPENKKIDDLLREFQTKKIHMAIVIDEYGGTNGIVTLEDIIEEIVGEIRDESDDEEFMFRQVDESSWLFDGKTSLNDFFKIVGVAPELFDNVKGDADTLAGLLLEIKGAIPAKDEAFELNDFTFQVESVDKRRIKQILVTSEK
jgi:putative hemolysin